MIGWGIALAVLAAIWFFPLGILVHYDADGLRVKMLLSLLRVSVYPRRRSIQKQTPKKQEKKPGTVPKEAPKESGGSLTDFLPLFRRVLELLVDFRKTLRVNRLELKVTMAGGEPDTLAANYGRAWAALGSLDATLENLFHIQRKELDLQCDFCGSQSTVYAHLEVTVTVGRLLRMGLRQGKSILPMLVELQNNRKGGATQ